MAYAIDAKKITTMANLETIFHQFDTENKQYFTKNDLKQYLARKGRRMQSITID